MMSSGIFGRHREFIPVTAIWPDFDAGLSPADRDLAQRVLQLPRIDVVRGDIAQATARPATRWYAVVEGTVLKETQLLGRTALELLGPGDVLPPSLTAEQQLEAVAVSRHLAHSAVSLAAIDDTFWIGARRWPGLVDLLQRQLAEQMHRSSAHLAMLHLARADDRLRVLFGELGKRHGQVRGGCVELGLPLTHDMIGQLIGSRRSTTSLALAALQSLINRRPDGVWQIDLSLVAD